MTHDPKGGPIGWKETQPSPPAEPAKTAEPGGALTTPDIASDPHGLTKLGIGSKGPWA